MEEKSYQRNSKFLTTLIGIFLILFSLALALNLGYIMRSIVAAFLFLFGNFYYAVLLLMTFEGFYLIIKSKLLLPPKRWQGILLFFSLLFMLMLTSAITMKAFDIQRLEDVIRDFFRLYNSFDGGYYANNARTYINTFSVSFGGGLFGYFLAVPVDLLTNIDITILIASVVVALTLGICFYKEIIKLIKAIVHLIKGTKAKHPRKTKEERLQEKYKHSFVNESDVYLHADEVGNDEVIPVMKSTELSSVDFNTINANLTPNNSSQMKPITDTGTIELARLDLFNETKDVETPFENQTVYVNPEEKEEVLTPIEEYEDNVEIKDNPIEVDITPANKIEEPITVKEEISVETSKEVVMEDKEVDILPMEEPVIEEIKIVQPVKEEKTIEVKPKKANWVPPSTDEFITYQTEEQVQQNIDAAREKQEIVNKTFEDFKVQAQCVDFVIGPSTTRLLIDYPSTGTIKAVDKLKNDISRRLNGISVRFAETVQGTRYSGFEVPNPVAATVSFKEVFEALPPASKHPTAVAFGKDITGQVIYADLCEFPHMLISGSTGSGKSVFVNSLIVTLMARTSPDDLKVVLVDPKRVEMNRYRDEPHLFCPVINDSNEAKVMLYKMVDFMNERYRLFEEADYATNIKDYNAWAKANNRKTMPYIVIFLDEYADLAYSCKEVGVPLVSICQKSRACGIHVVLCTQTPRADIITGTIKANLNTRVALTASSAVDSTVVLDEGGAEDLLGNGDMLVKSPLVSRTGLMRIQGCYIQGKEIAYVLNYLKKNYKPEYEESFLDLSEETPEPPTTAMFNSPLGESGDSEEDKYNWIKEWALMQDYVSMSKIQRECSVGFNRAGKMVRRLQDDGILSTESEGSNRGFKVIGGESRFNDAPPVNSDELKS